MDKVASAITIVILVILTAGFGLCGVFSLAWFGNGFSGEGLFYLVISIVIVIGSMSGIVSLVRSMHKADDDAA